MMFPSSARQGEISAHHHTVYDGRSFGTNMMEAALLAASGYKEKVDYRHPTAYFAMLAELIEKIGLKPQLQVLN